MRLPHLVAPSLTVLVTAVLTPVFAQDDAKPVVVKFHEPKTDEPKAELDEGRGPIDPALRVNIQPAQGMAYGLTAENVRLTFSAGSARTMFKIDEQMVFPNTAQPAPLVAKKGVQGFTSSFAHGK